MGNNLVPNEMTGNKDHSAPFWLVVATEVAISHDGSPTVSSHGKHFLACPPRVIQTSEEEAMQVAAKLAKANPGCVFSVMKTHKLLYWNELVGCGMGIDLLEKDQSYFTGQN